MNLRLVRGILFTGALALVRTPMDTYASRPSDGNSDLLVLQRREKELSGEIEKLETNLRLARQRLHTDPEAVQAREAIQASRQALQNLRERRKKADDAEMAQARETLQEMNRAYQALMDRKLAENPDTAAALGKIERYRAEHKRIATLVRLHIKQRRSAPLAPSAVAQ